MGKKLFFFVSFVATLNCLLLFAPPNELIDFGSSEVNGLILRYADLSDRGTIYSTASLLAFDRFDFSDAFRHQPTVFFRYFSIIQENGLDWYASNAFKIGTILLDPGKRFWWLQKLRNAPESVKHIAIPTDGFIPSILDVKDRFRVLEYISTHQLHEVSSFDWCATLVAPRRALSVPSSILQGSKWISLGAECLTSIANLHPTYVRFFVDHFSNFTKSPVVMLRLANFSMKYRKANPFSPNNQTILFALNSIPDALGVHVRIWSSVASSTPISQSLDYFMNSIMNSSYRPELQSFMLFELLHEALERGLSNVEISEQIRTIFEKVPPQLAPPIYTRSILSRWNYAFLQMVAAYIPSWSDTLKGLDNVYSPKILPMLHLPPKLRLAQWCRKLQRQEGRATAIVVPSNMIEAVNYFINYASGPHIFVTLGAVVSNSGRIPMIEASINTMFDILRSGIIGVLQEGVLLLNCSRNIMRTRELNQAFWFGIIAYLMRNDRLPFKLPWALLAALRTTAWFAYNPFTQDHVSHISGLMYQSCTWHEMDIYPFTWIVMDAISILSKYHVPVLESFNIGPHEEHPLI